MWGIMYIYVLYDIQLLFHRQVTGNLIYFRPQIQQAGQSKDNEEKKKSVPTEVPRITPHVELPPQVLQVC